MPRISREQRIFNLIKWSAVEGKIGGHGTSSSGSFTFKFPAKKELKDKLCPRIIEVF